MSTKQLFKSIKSIQLNNISKKYNDSYAVKNLDLTIYGGELLILIGGSGSGKTTTLKMINRLIEPDTGDIIINGTNTKQYDPVTLRRNIGYVIQQIGLFPHLNIRDNIGLVPKLEGWSAKKIDDRVKTLLRIVDLEPKTYMHRFPKELSGGQQQRIGLARAMAMDPRLLLMDEPFGALDPILRRQLHVEFLKIKKDINRTIIFVTHDINEAFKLGDRIAVMHEGKLQQIGTPEELIINPANRLIANLVDADYKFKHIETLQVKDLMTPVSSSNILPYTSTLHQTQIHMKKHSLELVIITQDSTYKGIIQYQDLPINGNKKEKLDHFIKENLTFDTNESMETALKKMKQKNQSIAIVLDHHRPIGILLPDEVLLKLI
jgi:osmoprotectant transport system ATP-binding protein